MEKQTEQSLLREVIEAFLWVSTQGKYQKKSVEGAKKL